MVDDTEPTGEGGSFELALIGGGNMGSALLRGVLDAGAARPADLAIVEVLPARRVELGEMFTGVAVHDSVPPCRAAVLAVKPGGVATAASAAAQAGATRLLSIAAGVRTDTIEAAVGQPLAVVRAMPNTPALVGAGTSAISGGSHAGDDDLAWAETILGAVGTVDRLPESLLDAFTGVAGSGPAYLFLVAEALVDASIAEGLPPEVAERAVTQLLVGSAALLAKEGDPAELRAKVTSPGGTTAAGLAVLEEREVRAALGAAVAAATVRSRELS
ncbi:MAG: pyrroline-5-carboxylate reductase [Ilumatobacteraceae bacterium]